MLINYIAIDTLIYEQLHCNLKISRNNNFRSNLFVGAQKNILINWEALIL